MHPSMAGKVGVNICFWAEKSGIHQPYFQTLIQGVSPPKLFHKLAGDQNSGEGRGAVD